MPSSFALGDHFESFIRSMVASGRYNNASEVVREGLRLLEDRQSELTLRRAELLVSADEAYDDVAKNGGLTVEDVDAHFRRRIEQMTERSRS